MAFYIDVLLEFFQYSTTVVIKATIHDLVYFANIVQWIKLPKIYLAVEINQRSSTTSKILMYWENTCLELLLYSFLIF